VKYNPYYTKLHYFEEKEKQFWSDLVKENKLTVEDFDEDLYYSFKCDNYTMEN
jgi:hypothetical protein